MWTQHFRRKNFVLTWQYGIYQVQTSKLAAGKWFLGPSYKDSNCHGSPSAERRASDAFQTGEDMSPCYSNRSDVVQYVHTAESSTRNPQPATRSAGAYRSAVKKRFCSPPISESFVIVRLGLSPSFHVRANIFLQGSGHPTPHNCASPAAVFPVRA